MIFYAGVILCIVGIVQFIRFLMKSSRTKVEGFIQEITLEYHEKDKMRFKKHPHGLVKYTYKSVDYEKKLLLMRRNCQVGDKIELSVKGENPEKVEMIAANAEMLTALILFILGLGLIAGSIAIMDTFNLW